MPEKIVFGELGVLATCQIPAIPLLVAPLDPASFWRDKINKHAAAHQILMQKLNNLNY